MTDNSQFLYDIDNAIEALAKLQNYSMSTDWVTLSDEGGKITISLGDSIDNLLSELYKKELKVRKTVYDEEMASLEAWERNSTQGQASHQPAEQDA